MIVTFHLFLVQAFGHDLEKIKNYLLESNIEKIYVNEKIQVNTENYLANFLTYSHIQ
jgi:hypothetical protein